MGYRRAGVTIPDFTHESAGAGTLAPDTMSLRGVEYTVDALAVVSVSGSGWNVGLRTDPLLPRGQDLWLELEHVDGSTAVFAIDTASVEAPGYLWRAVYAGEDRHGWGTDSADADTDIDSVTVRLSTGAPTITGTAQVGQTLTAVTTGITDADGLTSATYTYQWIQVNGTAADIAGENSSTYTLVDADLGKAIKVKVSFTDDASNAETRTSAATATVTAAATTTTQTLVSNTGRGNAGNRPVAANPVRAALRHRDQFGRLQPGRHRSGFPGCAERERDVDRHGEGDLVGWAERDRPVYADQPHIFGRFERIPRAAKCGTERQYAVLGHGFLQRRFWRTPLVSDVIIQWRGHGRCGGMGYRHYVLV